jgi:hypothetical protein
MNAQPHDSPSGKGAFRQSDLEGYLDETLPVEDMAAMEKALRGNIALLEQLSSIRSRRESGVHSLAEIWRSGRLSCPSREQLGSFLLGVLPEEESGYVAVHVESVGCRFCRANLSDLEHQQSEAADARQTRRRKYFQSSAGYLRRK